MTTYDENQIKHLELVAKTTEKVQAFNSLMIAVGYATFLALWANVKGCATPTSHMVAGACLVVSVVLFVAWHIIGMVAMNISVMSLLSFVDPSPGQEPVTEPPIPTGKALELARQALNDPESGLSSVQKVTLRMTLTALRVAKFWPYALATILLPALVGMGILFATYVHGAWLGYKGHVIQCTVQSKG
jgi:Na+/phosphate symporter